MNVYNISMKNKKLLHRAQFCPIGVKCNVRLLPSTFTKMCLAHQRKSVHKHEYGVFGIDAGSLIHTHACSVCPVGPHIRKGVDPVSIVADVEWFTLEEVDALHMKIKEVTADVMKAIKKSKKKQKKGALAKMRRELNRMKDVIRELDILVDSVINQVDSSMAQVAVEKATQPTVEAVETQPVKEAPVKVQPKKNYKQSTIDLAKSANELISKGLTRKEVASKLNLSAKYVGTLLSVYKEIS